MRLISCHIENFGRLRNLDWRFEEGTNMICRENGWGKTTFSVFLRAMFYGFPGGRKKKTEDNERERYRPWQGGVYGGRLVFEAGGKRYEMTRVFGRRESEDDFELRDLGTGLLSRDYTAKIGEELFCLDRDSFSRTVFTGQQDCGAAATDDVNALVADLTDHAGDMGGYEAAMKRLTEAANRLTPRRTGGSLYRRAEEIRQLEREAGAGQEISARLDLCEKEGRAAAAKERELAEELKGLDRQIKAAEREEERVRHDLEEEKRTAGKREIWRRLRSVRTKRRRELDRAAAVFPGRAPAREEVDRCLAECRELEKIEAGIQAVRMSEEDHARLEELEKLVRDEESEALSRSRGPENRIREGELEALSQEKKPAASFHGREREGARKALVKGAALVPRKIVPVLLGAVLLAAGLTGMLLSQNHAFFILAAAGVAAAAAGLLGSPGPKKPPAGEGADTSADRKRLIREYEDLREKERREEELYVDWSRTRRPLLLFLKELGFFPGEDLRLQLEELRDAADECEDAGRLLREAETELRAYEEELRGEGISLSAASEHKEDRNMKHGEAEKEAKIDYRESGSLRDRAEKVRTALLSCRDAQIRCGREAEELRGEYEEWENMVRQLELLRLEQEAEEAQYRRILAAASSLRDAKEALTARYADPITAGFRRYWEKITGYSAAGAKVDADSKVTLEERGKRREASLLSTGYRDLAGICLRIALADAMYPPGKRERPPLIMDDPFAGLDDEKAERAVRFLKDMGRDYQILYFTCSSSRC